MNYISGVLKIKSLSDKLPYYSKRLLSVLFNSHVSNRALDKNLNLSTTYSDLFHAERHPKIESDNIETPLLI